MLTLRRLSFALLLLAANLAITCPAQPPNTPAQPLTIEAVLARVRANVAAYSTSLPNFICDESIDSRRTGGGKLKDEMKIESSFSIVRQADGISFREIRVKNLVNGSKPRNQKISPPYFFSGGIGNLIQLVDDKCAHFAFAPVAHPAGDAPVVITDTHGPASPDMPVYCARLRKHNYRAQIVIDPRTFQVLHIESSEQDVSFGLASHLPFVPVPSAQNTLTVSVDYASIALGGKTFRLPQTVTSTVTDRKKPLTLEYAAHYSNYHRFATTSTILPAVKEASNNPANPN